MAIPTITNDYQVPAVYNIKIVRGNDYNRSFVFAESITGDTFEAEILLNGVTYLPIPITVNESTKTVSLQITDIVSVLLLGTYRWYLNRTHNDEVRTLLSGTMEYIVE